MKVHELKTDPAPFSDLHAGVKTFEIRFNDRNYQVGDALILKEYDRNTSKYSGRMVIRKVSHILHGSQYGIKPGFAILSLCTI